MYNDFTSDIVGISKPRWLKAKAPGSPEYLKTRILVKNLCLHTVCEEAHCPNIGECWSQRTATFLILGEHCSRSCRFCAVKKGGKIPGENNFLVPPDTIEPEHVGEAVQKLGLKHAVVTSVTRDDLPDFGALHYARTVEAIHRQAPNCKVELLIPDFQGSTSALKIVLSSQISVLNHNLETVPRLYPEVRPAAVYSRSLGLLEQAKKIDSKILTKSGIMVGLGESYEEVLSLMKDLRCCSVDILTIGQYLRPGKDQVEVRRFVTPEEFKEYEKLGYQQGFKHLEAGPMVRSSYHAWKHSAGAGSGAG